MEPLTTERLQEIQGKAAQDPEYQQLLTRIIDRFPDCRHQLPESCRWYWNVREHLSVDDGLIVYGCCLIIPSAMRQEVFTPLWLTPGVKQQACLMVYWPEIDNDLDNIILACQLCQDHLPSHPKELLIQKPKPLQPFQVIAADYCSYGGKQFLILIDCFTDWPEIIPTGQDTMTHLITTLQ